LIISFSPFVSFYGASESDSSFSESDDEVIETDESAFAAALALTFSYILLATLAALTFLACDS
jgi:hypothetical protein